MPAVWLAGLSRLAGLCCPVARTVSVGGKPGRKQSPGQDLRCLGSSGGFPLCYWSG